jgi:hypothetical protein
MDLIIETSMHIIKKEDWVQFLQRCDFQDFEAVLKLAERKSSVSLRLALAEILPHLLRDDYFKAARTLENRSRLYSRILKVANTGEPGGSELRNQIINLFNKIKCRGHQLLLIGTAWSDNNYPDSYNRNFETNTNCWQNLFCLASSSHTESEQLRSIIFRSMTINLGWNFEKRLDTVFFDLMRLELNTKNPENIKVICQILGIRHVHSETYEMQFTHDKVCHCFPRFISQLSIENIIQILNYIDFPEDICRLFDTMEISTLNDLKIFLVAKLSAYIRSNNATLVNINTFFSMSDTKLKLSNALALVNEISSCSSIDSIKIKITNCQTFNNQIDSERKLLFGQSAYSKCLEECMNKVNRIPLKIPPTPNPTFLVQ